MEGVVAGVEDGCSGRIVSRVPDKTRCEAMRRRAGTQDTTECWVAWAPALQRSAEGRCIASGARKQAYLTTPDVNPAFRRGGLMSFFRKQRASRPV